MTIGTVNPNFPVGTDMDQFDVGLLTLGTTSLESSTSFVVTIGQEQVAFGGSNFTFDNSGNLTGGSILAIQDEYQGVVEFNMSGFSISATSLQAWATADDNASLNAALFSGADTLTGGPQSDLLHAYGGGDSISGGGGNDTIIVSGLGNETLGGGPGQDVITTGGGSDVIVVELHASGVTQTTADLITDWNSTDTLSFAYGPTGSNDLAKITTADFATAASDAANIFLAGTAHVVVAAVGSEVVVFADSANDNTTGDVVILQGATLSEVGINNFTLSGSSGSSGSPASSPPLVSPPPPPLTMPTAPTGLALDPSADSGIKGDGITDVAKVVVDGVAQPGVTVTLLDGATVVGATTANATTGAFSVASTSALADGEHTLNVEASDAAGDVSPMSSLSVLIDTHPIGASITGLTETTSGSKIVAVITGLEADPTSTVRVFEDGGSIGNVKTAGGTWSVTTNVTNAVHTFTTQTTDAAGDIAQGLTTLIYGTSGSDKIAAGAGNVIVNGGGGVDAITAGSGADVFVYNALSNAPMPKGKGNVAMINNFQPATDKLDLTHLGHMIYQGEASSVSSHEVSWYVSSGNTFVIGDGDSTGRANFTIELTGVHTLTAADFLLA